MSANFTAYIDESGDAGISKIRQDDKPGSSPYFVLGAVVCQPTAEVFVKNKLEEFKNDIKKSSWKHATDLGHAEKVYLAREMGKLPVRYFALISNKETLKGYKENIGHDPHKFYNKCVKYLIELICRYLQPHVSSPDNFRVVLERRNHDYDAMIRYLQVVRNKPIYEQSKVLNNFNPFSVSTLAKGESEMLEVADFVAHAVFQLTNRVPSNYGIPEPRYFVEISSRFAGNMKNRPLGAGIKCIHDLDSLNLDRDIVKIIRSVQVRPASTKI